MRIYNGAVEYDFRLHFVMTSFQNEVSITTAGRHRLFWSHHFFRVQKRSMHRRRGISIKTGSLQRIHGSSDATTLVTGVFHVDHRRKYVH